MAVEFPGNRQNKRYRDAITAGVFRNEHTCHAKDCRAAVPPRMFMCVVT